MQTGTGRIYVTGNRCIYFITRQRRLCELPKSKELPTLLCTRTTLWPETRVLDSWRRRVPAGPEVVVLPPILDAHLCDGRHRCPPHPRPQVCLLQRGRHWYTVPVYHTPTIEEESDRRSSLMFDVCTWMPHKPFEEIFLEEYHGRFFHFPFFRSILAAKCQLFYSSFSSNHPGAKSKNSSPRQ